MQIIKYVKINPNQNLTILVLSEHLREEYGSIAKKLMLPISVYGEQVGFVKERSNSQFEYQLEMMGGEYCANAIASLAAYLAYEDKQDNSYYFIKCSGSELLIRCEVSTIEQGYRVNLPMPLPIAVKDETIFYKDKNIVFGVVEYEGICHAIIWDCDLNIEPEILAKHILYECLDNKYKTKGVSLFSNITQSIRTMVYVKETDTEVWENGCGIASASIGIYMAHKKQKDICTDIKQAGGGTVRVYVSVTENRITNVKMEEDVFIVSKGIAFI